MNNDTTMSVENWPFIVWIYIAQNGIDLYYKWDYISAKIWANGSHNAKTFLSCNVFTQYESNETEFV